MLAPDQETGLDWKRLAKVAAAGVGLLIAFDLGVQMLWILLGFYRVGVSYKIRAWVPLGSEVLLVSWLQSRPRWPGRWRIPELWWERVDRWSDQILSWRLSALLAGVIGVWMVGWVPQYLVWPWWADTDHFAMLAMAWDAGSLPYRDVIDYNFPGAIYWMWGLGKAFGWGKTVPYYVVDVAMVIGLGFATVAWSRKKYGIMLPGLLGFVPFLSDYLGLSASLVAQRDWYATLFIVFALFVLEAGGGRWARVGSAALLGASLSFRPYGVLFLPALISAVDENTRRDGEPWSPFRRGLAEWLVASAVMTIVAFSPLIFAGVFDDFLRSLRYVQPGGPYNRNTPDDFLDRLRTGAVNWRFLPTIGTLALIALLGPSRDRRIARTWALAMLGVAFYQPLSPVAHVYMNIPRALVTAVGMMPAFGWLLVDARIKPPVRLVAILVIFSSTFNPWPIYWGPLWSVKALGPLVRGEIPSNRRREPSVSWPKTFRSRIATTGTIIAR